MLTLSHCPHTHTKHPNMHIHSRTDSRAHTSLVSPATSDGCEALLQRMIDTIMGSKGMEAYDRLLGYCDTDTSDEEKYTVRV